MKKKVFFSILGVLAISVLTVGITYAFYASETSGDIAGEATSGVDTELTLDKIYHASKLVPLNDSLIGTAISKTTNKCIDKSGYEVCSLYKITLENTVDSETLYGYIRTNESTYTTNNLKYQFFDSNYSSLTDVMTLSKTKDEVVYFQKNETNYSVTIQGSITYYLAVWLTDTGVEQSEDYFKDFSGYVGFESLELSGAENSKIESGFNA